MINAILIFICAGLITRDSSEDPEMDLPAIHISLNDCTLEETMMVLPAYLMREIPLIWTEKNIPTSGSKAEEILPGKCPGEVTDQASQTRLCAWHAPAKKWLLISNYADASMMRNKLMYDLAGRLRILPRRLNLQMYGLMMNTRGPTLSASGLQPEKHP